MSDLKPCPFCGREPMVYNQSGLIICAYSMCGVNPESKSKECWNSRAIDSKLARQQEEIDEPVYGMSMFSCGCLEEVGSQLTKKQAEDWCKELNKSNDDHLDKYFFVTYDYHLAKHNKGE